MAPILDVSEVIGDPLVAGEAFQVIRRQASVTAGGVNQVQTITFQALGSIQPTGDNSLVREEAYQVQAKTIKVITNFLLRGVSKDASGSSFQPDLVLWNGDYYLVRSVDNWSHYGVGMVEAECASIDYRNFAPSGLLPSLDMSNPADSQSEPNI